MEVNTTVNTNHVFFERIQKQHRIQSNCGLKTTASSDHRIFDERIQNQQIENNSECIPPDFCLANSKQQRILKMIEFRRSTCWCVKAKQQWIHNINEFKNSEHLRFCQANSEQQWIQNNSEFITTAHSDQARLQSTCFPMSEFATTTQKLEQQRIQTTWCLKIEFKTLVNSEQHRIQNNSEFETTVNPNHFLCDEQHQINSEFKTSAILAFSIFWWANSKQQRI